MYVSHSAASVHARPGVLKPEESYQGVASSPANDVLVAVSQLQVHFWMCGPNGALVYLSSVDVPRASLDEDPAVHALWHPHQHNHLAIITSRRVLFMEADLHPARQGFLGLNHPKTLLARENTCSRAASFCDVQSRVCFGEEVVLESGLVTSVSSAGPTAFLVSTTAGVVNIVGWNAQRVLHSFTVATLRAPHHCFAVVNKTERGGGASGSFASSQAAGAPVAGATGADAGGDDASAEEASFEGQQQQQQHIHHHILTGAILHATFNVKLQLFSMVLSSGYVLLAHPSGGVARFAQSTQVSLRGYFLPAVAAYSSALNGTHRLLAIATHSGSVSCYPLSEHASRSAFVDQHAQGDLSGAVLKGYAFSHSSPCWRRNGTHQGDGTLVRSYGPISGMEWSPGGEEVLAVGFFRVGVMAVHYAGACLFTSFSTDAASHSPMLSPQQRAAGVVECSAQAQVSRSAMAGCLSLHWCQQARRLIAVEPQGTQLLGFRVARVVSARETGPGVGVHTPLCLVDDDGVFLTDYSAADGTDTQSAFVAAPPSVGTTGALPLRYSSVSPGGNYVAVAGRKGLSVFARHWNRWHTFDSEGEKAPCVCLCDPVWLSESVVAVAVVQDRSKFTIAAFLVDHLRWPAALAKQPLDGRPVHLATTIRDARADGFLVCQDVNHRLHVLRFNLFRDSYVGSKQLPWDTAERTRVLFTPLRCVEPIPTEEGPVNGHCRTSAMNGGGGLGTVVSQPLSVRPVCTSAAGIRDIHAGGTQPPDDVPSLLIHSRVDHGLYLLSLAGEDAFTARARQFQTIHLGTGVGYAVTRLSPTGSMVCDIWVDRFSPLDGVNLAVREGEGLHYYHVTSLAPRLSRASHDGVASGSAPAHQVERVLVASRESEIIPLCLSPFDGVAIGVLEGREVALLSPSAAPLQCNAFGAHGNRQGFMFPILLAPRVLGLLLQQDSLPASATQHAAAQQSPQDRMTAAGADMTAERARDSAVAVPRSSPVGPGSAIPVQVARAKEAAAASSVALPRGERESSTSRGGGRMTASFAWDEGLFRWLQSLRESGTFTVTFDCFLMSVLDDSPPGGVPHLDRKSAVRAVVGLLRSFPEFHEVMVGCIRKIDMSRWHVVFDFLGSPLDLYQECIENGRFAEAVHLVRVIMMTGYGAQQALREGAEEASTADKTSVRDSNLVPSTPAPTPSRRETLQQACACAIRLFGHVLRNGDFSSAYDLLRFTALVRHEIGMPAAVEMSTSSDGNGQEASGAAGSALGRWLRTLVGGTASEAATTAGGGAATSETQTAGPSSASGLPAIRSIPVKGYPTLYFHPSSKHHATGIDGGALGSPTHIAPSMDEAEQAQRLTATRMMFATYPELPAMVSREAAQLFLQGRLLRLCRLMETFSLSLPDFVREQLLLSSTQRPSAPQEGAAPSPALRLGPIFDGLHRELGLPRSPQPLGYWGSQALCEPGSPLQSQMGLWTQAQVTLYGNRRILDVLRSLQVVFGGSHAYLDVSFALLRMSSADVLAVLTRVGAGTGVSPAAEAEWTPARIATCAALLADVTELLRVPANRGYNPFLDSLVDALPPRMLQASGYVMPLRPPQAFPGSEAPTEAAAGETDGPARPGTEAAETTLTVEASAESPVNEPEGPETTSSIPA